MIASIKGTIQNKKESFIILENQGIGYKIFVPENISKSHAVGDQVSIYTYQHFSESNQALYGFSTYDEQDFFELLLSISGIGPKVALGVLNAATLMDIREAVISNNPEILTKISGIGKKTAERIVLELKNKITVGDIRPIGTKSLDIGHASNLDVYDALIQLGYNSIEARAALKMIPDSIKDPEKKLKEALKNLGRK